MDQTSLSRTLLEIEQIANCDVFQAEGIRVQWARLYGGQTIAQSLLSASLTVPDDKPIHSLHAYFIVAGDSNKKILYEVDRVRDGRSFFTRAVKAKQDNCTICHTICSFHKEEPGLIYQLPLRDVLSSCGVKELPNPESFLNQPNSNPHSQVLRHLVASGQDWTVHYVKVDVPKDEISGWRAHTTILAYLSDHDMVSGVRRPHEQRNGVEKWGMCLSLDHSIHFHHPKKICVNDWTILFQSTKVSAGARGMSTSSCYSLSGELLATYNQEALIRPPRDSKQARI